MPELSECKTCHKPVSISAFSCPHCCGTSVSSIGQQQFSAGKAIGRAMLLGVLGLAGGAVGPKHIIFVCEQCGYRWKADPANLPVNAPPGTPLEIGDVLQGRAVEIIPFAFNPEAEARIDLGEGRYGTLYNFANVNRKRKRRGREPISLGNEITVRVR